MFLCIQLQSRHKPCYCIHVPLRHKPETHHKVRMCIDPLVLTLRPKYCGLLAYRALTSRMLYISVMLTDKMSIVSITLMTAASSVTIGTLHYNDIILHISKCNDVRKWESPWQCLPSYLM